MIFGNEKFEKDVITKLDKIQVDIMLSLSKEDSLRVEISALRALVDSLNQTVCALESRIKESSSRSAETEPVAQQPTRKPVSCEPVSQKPLENRPKESTKPVSRTFYAMSIVGDENVVYEVSDNEGPNVPYVVTVCGDKGEARLNGDYLSYALKSIEGRLLPFFEYELKSNPPTTAVAINTAPVSFRDGKWVMDRRIKIILQ